MPSPSLPAEMLKTVWREDVYDSVPGLDFAAAPGWRLLAILPAGQPWSAAQHVACRSEAVHAETLRRGESSFFVSQPVFATTECRYPPVGLNPGILDFDWAVADWSQRDASAAIARLARALEVTPLARLGQHIRFVCTGYKGLHLLYDFAALDTNPRVLRDEIRELVPELDDPDRGLYLDLPHLFHRVPGTLNYHSRDDQLTSHKAVELDMAALGDGRLEAALAEQWFPGGFPPS